MVACFWFMEYGLMDEGALWLHEEGEGAGFVVSISFIGRGRCGGV